MRKMLSVAIVMAALPVTVQGQGMFGHFVTEGQPGAPQINAPAPQAELLEQPELVGPADAGAPAAGDEVYQYYSEGKGGFSAYPDHGYPFRRRCCEPTNPCCNTIWQGYCQFPVSHCDRIHAWFQHRAMQKACRQPAPCVARTPLHHGWGHGPACGHCQGASKFAGPAHCGPAPCRPAPCAPALGHHVLSFGHQSARCGQQAVGQGARLGMHVGGQSLGLAHWLHHRLGVQFGKGHGAQPGCQDCQGQTVYHAPAPSYKGFPAGDPQAYPQTYPQSDPQLNPYPPVQTQPAPVQPAPTKQPQVYPIPVPTGHTARQPVHTPWWSTGFSY